MKTKIIYLFLFVFWVSPLSFSEENYRLDTALKTEKGYLLHFAPVQVKEYSPSLLEMSEIISMRIRGWHKSSESENSVTMALENYKGYTVRLRIEQRGDKLFIVPVEDYKIGCEGTKEKCRVKDAHYSRWVNNFRRHMSKAIQEDTLKYLRSKNS